MTRFIHQTRAVVLAAGASRRMGRPKALLPVDGVPLVRAHVDAFAAMGLPTTIVLGAWRAEIDAVLPPEVERLVNPDWETTGPAESAALALAGGGVVLLTPVDVPPARPETIRALLAGVGDAVPTFGGADGHPVRLDPPHPLGVRLDERLRPARRVPVADPDCLRNLNRPEDWEAWIGAR